jgi:hypothetical protein
MNGRSKLFKMKNLDALEIQKTEDLFLLYLPNFWMQTHFEFLLIRKDFILLRKILDSVEKFFDDFLKNENLINKICDLFIYFIKQRSHSKKEDLENSYREIYQNDDDDDGENGGVEYDKITQNDLEVQIKKYLDKIIEEIKKNTAYLQRSDSNFVLLVLK